MSTSSAAATALRQLSLGIALLGLGSGFLLSYGVLGSDSAGQVNLLFLLLLYVVLPVLSLILSLVLLARGGGKGLAGWLLELPLWPRRLQLALPALSANHSLQPWLFYQTQVLSLAFALACLALYLLLLLGSDLSFVWRSTLLEAGDLLPVLQFIALPWSFWSDAQPTLEVLQQTRDFRSAAAGPSQAQVGLWWQYILAAQLCYNLLPRSLMLLVARRRYLQRLREGFRADALTDSAQSAPAAGESLPLAQVVTAVAGPYLLLDWANAPALCREKIQTAIGHAERVMAIGPLQAAGETIAAGDRSQVVLVKSWEPPLAELADCLASLGGDGERLLLPLDWTDADISAPRQAHLDEWRRFVATLPGWKLLSLEAAP